MRFSTTLLLLFTATLLGCGGSPGDGTGGGSSTASGDTTSSGGDGCERGLVRCGDTCRDIQSDDAHCGACGSKCGAGETCRSRTCRPPGFACDGAGTSGTLCGAQCVLSSQNVDHCGACGKACGAESYCSEDGQGTCKPWQGHGTACESPIVISDTGNFSLGFWFVDGSAPRIFGCGALEPRPAVTFRWTPGKSDDGQKFKVYGASTDDLVIEVFSAAPCSSATSLGCNNDSSATTLTPELQIPVEGGKPYFIVVGSVAAKAPLGRFELHLDD